MSTEIAIMLGVSVVALCVASYNIGYIFGMLRVFRAHESVSDRAND